MTTNNTGVDTDFNPDLNIPKKNVKKTSVNLDEAVRQGLNDIKCANVSDYINKAVADRLELDKENSKSAFRYDSRDYIKVELWLHKDMAEFLKLLEIIKGAIPLADKLAELVNNDQYGIKNGDVRLYGVGQDDFDRIISSYQRSIQRLKNK